MKLLYIITKSNWGGAQKYVHDLAVYMKGTGHEVLVASGGEGSLDAKLAVKNIPVIKIPNLERDVNFLKELKVLRNIYRILKKEKPDIVHLNSSKIGGSGSLVARLVGIKKIVFTAHGWPFREERPFWQVVIIKFLSWLTIIFSHQVICVSKKDFLDVKNWLLVGKKIRVVHNGIAIVDSLSNMSMNNGVVKLVSIGELHKNKGFEYGLLAINALKDEIKNFKYTILSFGGEELDNLKRSIKDKGLGEFVELRINNERHSDSLKDFDIYFMPSLKEGLPYVLLEAGLNYLPSVASNTGGISEIVEDGESGLLVPSKDINGFKLALKKLIQDETLREKFGLKSRRMIEEKFSFKKMAKKTEDVYSGS